MVPSKFFLNFVSQASLELGEGELAMLTSPFSSPEAFGSKYVRKVRLLLHSIPYAMFLKFRYIYRSYFVYHKH